MRRSSLVFDDSILLPKVWPVEASDLATLYRWRFTDGEIRDLAELDADSLPTNLTAEIAFELQVKQYRRSVFADLAGCGGWLAVAALRLESVLSSQWYVLASCFTDYGRPVDYAAVFELFEGVKHVQALERTPAEVASRFDSELSKAVQMAQWHWAERWNSDFKYRSERLEASVERERSELEQVLKELNGRILSLSSASDADARASEIEALRQTKVSKREELLKLDATDLERFGALMSRKLPPAATVWRLYSLCWSIGEPTPPSKPPVAVKPKKKTSGRRKR